MFRFFPNAKRSPHFLLNLIKDLIAEVLFLRKQLVPIEILCSPGGYHTFCIAIVGK